MSPECAGCPFARWPAWCFAARRDPLCSLAATSPNREAYRDVITSAMLDPRSSVRPLDWSAIIAIESCRVRASECHCIDRPATCSRGPSPVRAVCSRSGPGGGPCPGV